MELEDMKTGGKMEVAGSWEEWGLHLLDFCIFNLPEIALLFLQRSCLNAITGISCAVWQACDAATSAGQGVQLGDSFQLSGWQHCMVDEEPRHRSDVGQHQGCSE